MRHYIAVKDGDGRWWYANEGVDRQGNAGWAKSGACLPLIVCPDCKDELPLSTAQKACQTCGGRGLVDDPNPCNGHDTAEEAYEHQKQHILATRLRFLEDRDDARTLHTCAAEGCKVHTSGSATAGPYRHWSLCAEHRTPEVVAALLHVGESWES